MAVMTAVTTTAAVSPLSFVNKKSTEQMLCAF